ncbi:ras-like protein family member 10B [Biomphalaria pfeifferi]|uniref:Ras-like protein family member 10B n=1 Tax=Biomphalaria pfeifferi TaxID=112525 RepID=A0AAD8F210_BIOPF|nr:ras-like protein family member 10B [Biomphalaria pfeifferi]
MTIPQGEIRGSQSVSDRRKVTFANESSVVSQLEPTSKANSCRAENHLSANCLASGDSICDSRSEEPLSISGFQGARYTTEKSNANDNSSETEYVEAKVTVVAPTETKRSPLPLLRFLRSSETSSSNRSRKLSLNLPKSLQNHISISQASDKLRRHSQPQKASYQRVPQDDLSPPPPDQPHIFTLQQKETSESEELDADSGYGQRLSTHSAQVHATFNDRDLEPSIVTSSRGSSGSKKVFFGKIRHQSPSKASSCKSLDDLSLVHHHHHGEASGNPRSISAHNSASSEDLSSASRRKRLLPQGEIGGSNPRRHPPESHTSPGSPSHCCLVSVSRVPMAAATSHLTLDSEYQTVRLAVLGAPGVGKSSIVRQFVMQQFLEEYVPTEQRQVFCPAVIINEHLYEVRIIDCPYIPYFPVNSLYEWTDFRGYGLRNATAYVLVYDITSEESFEYIKSLRLQILESRNCHDVPIFVVGNKHDLADERGVPRREVREVANMVKKQWKCGYIECSAKYNWHIMLLFKELMKTVDYIDYGHKPTSMRVQDALRRNRCLIL